MGPWGLKKEKMKEERKESKESKEKQGVWNFFSIKYKKSGILRLSAESKHVVVWLGHLFTFFFLISLHFNTDTCMNCFL